MKKATTGSASNSAKTSPGFETPVVAFPLKTILRRNGGKRATK